MNKLYNLIYLEEISGGDRNFIIEMLKDFVANTPYSIKEIEKLASSKEWDLLYKSVHKFIPSFDFIGAESIKNDLKNLEHYSKTQINLEKIPSLLFNIKDFSYKVIKEIKIEYNL